MAQFEGKLQKALERVKLLLEAEKRPQLATEVQHSYEDKFQLVAVASNLALSSQLNCLGSLGLDTAKLRQLRAWAEGNAVSLRFRSRESCSFVREETREVEDPTRRVNEISFAGMSMGLSSRTVTKVTEFFWRFDFAWELEALRGVGADDSERLPLLARRDGCELRTGSKTPPQREKSSAQLEVEVSFLLRHITSDEVPAPQFSVDRAAKACRTPRRNAEVEEMEKYMKKLSSWSAQVSAYMTGLFQKCRPTEQPLQMSCEVFVAVLPLFVQSSGTEELVVSKVDSNRLLLEESRLLAERRQSLQEEIGSEGFSSLEAYVLLSHLHCFNVVEQWLQVLAYVEAMLRKQLVAAIGKEVTPVDFAAYMRFHHRRLFREAFAPKPFCSPIRRSQDHDPEGSLGIEEMGETIQPICTSCCRGKVEMKIPLNASTQVSFTGEAQLHAYLGHQFSSDTGAKLSLVARARQFSSFIVLLGHVTSATGFEAKHAVLLQNKDELQIPLDLATIPTPKEFKDAIESLSPEQQRFAKAFRAMQLESTLFGIVVVQIKPQLERLLNLPEESLTKEIKLTQDLMQLFIQYQIPSDLLSFAPLGVPGVPATQVQLQTVRQQVRAMHDMIEAEKREELEERKQEAEFRKEREQREQRIRDEMDQTKQLVMQNVEDMQKRCATIKDISCDFSNQSKAFYKAARSSRGSLLSRGAGGGMFRSITKVSSESDRRSSRPDTAMTASPSGAAGAGPAPAKKKSDQAAKGSRLDPKAPAPPPPGQRQQRGHERSEVKLEGRDYTEVPSQLDADFEQLDPDSALRATIVSCGASWTKRSQAKLLAQQTTETLDAEKQKREKDAAFDLLDAMTKSGALPLSHASLHIVVAATHCFDKSVLETVTQDNVNPIEKVERSSLIMAATVHQQPALAMIQDTTRARVMACSPQLFLEDAP
eukprot:CAMPEP_0181445170 /NCGR_PEP_ID=MMETSP1110-20121109/25449_1 /TAXON_ID=174948 /ORGANISM="Symbiodinium sp., Strain CCMP421" /LENGTH=931 /DNA_ID=CAMNT_0023569205 /DNA_START=73 /DNA_END=2868 /DNA_ORIENTATION=+